MHPMQNGAVTADQLLAMPEDGLRRELVRGTVRAVSPAGFEHGSAVQRLSALVGAYVLQHDLGEALGAETGFLLSEHPDTVLAPDFAFVRRGRVPSTRVRGWFRGAPDLAVEVVSPGDSSVAVFAKAHQWLTHGATLVWIVDPDRRTVTAVRGANVRVLVADDALEATDLLPGFRCAVAALFRPVAT
jgi:Uma2 family endonuclease